MAVVPISRISAGGRRLHPNDSSCRDKGQLATDPNTGVPGTFRHRFDKTAGEIKTAKSTRVVEQYVQENPTDT